MFCSMLPAPASAGSPADRLTGRWYTRGNQAIFEFYQDGDHFCGRLFPLRYPNLIDSLNPADSLKTRRLAGATTIYGLRFNEKKQCWEDGFVYNPSDGKTYHCTCRLSADSLHLDFRGYIGVSALGQTQRWTRVAEPKEK